MDITLNRFGFKQNSTLGILLIDNVFECFTLEDGRREVKIPDQTCIPSGCYKISKNTSPTPKTMKYRKLYSFFDFHLEIEDVPAFTNVYLHVGNTISDSSGCILLGRSTTTKSDDFTISESADAFKFFYEKVSKTLLTKEPVLIHIRDLI